MLSSSGNFTSLRSYSPFQVISRFWNGSSSVSPSPVPPAPIESTAETVGLNILSNAESFEDLELNLPAKIKPTALFIETSPYSQFLSIDTSSNSNSPYSIVATGLDSFSPRQEEAPLKKSVSFNEAVDALSISHLREPSPEKIRKYIEKEWDSGNLGVTREDARDALIKQRIRSKIVQLKLLN